MTRTAPILGDLSIELENGTVLTDRTDLGLARKWAEYENGPEWDGLTFVEQNVKISIALDALRKAYAAGS